MGVKNRWQVPLRKPKRQNDRRFMAPRNTRPHLRL